MAISHSHSQPTFDRFLSSLLRHEQQASRSICLTPSENILSPLARVPFVLDTYSRYFLDDLRLFGQWFFRGGQELGSIEQDVLLPLLRQMARASEVNVRPISGLNCMTVALAALAKSGQTILTVPIEMGGHASTTVVANRLGINTCPIPFSNAFDVDLDHLKDVLAQLQPAVVYLDQSTLLFPIDPAPIRQLIDQVSPETLLHYDSSHLNGLILGGAIFNPLEQGAHCFGGSTHKTLPGPHKGFFATNDRLLAQKFQMMTDHFVSHHHMSDVVSLTVTLIEMVECDGAEYARRVIRNAQSFAAALSERDVFVAAADRGFTACHQVWVKPDSAHDMNELANRLYRCGLIVNNFNNLPGIPYPALRLSLAEITRLGATEKETTAIAASFADSIFEKVPEYELRKRVEHIRDQLRRPQYCFGTEKLNQMGVPESLVNFCEQIPSLSLLSTHGLTGSEKTTDTSPRDETCTV